MIYKEVSLKEAQSRMLEMLIEVDKICKENNIEYWLEGGTLLGAIRHKGFIPWDDDIDISVLRKDYNKLKIALKNNLPKKYFYQSPITDKYVEAPWIRVKDNNSYIEDGLNKKYHKGLWIDIFPFDESTEKNIKTKKKIDRFINLKWKSELPYKPKSYKRNLGIFLLRVFYKIIPYKKIIKNIYKLGEKVEIKELKEINYGIECPWNLNIKKDHIFPLKKGEFSGYDFPIPNKSEKILELLYGQWSELPPEEQRNPTHSNKIYIK